MRSLILVWLTLLIAAPYARAATDPNGPVSTVASLKGCTNCPAMVLIPAGIFQMGVPEAESEREGVSDDNARPVHTVRIGQPFYLGKYHVTRREYAAFAKATGREIVPPLSRRPTITPLST